MHVGRLFMVIVPLEERDDRSRPLEPKGRTLASWVYVVHQDHLPLCVSLSSLDWIIPKSPEAQERQHSWAPEQWTGVTSPLNSHRENSKHKDAYK